MDKNEPPSQGEKKLCYVVMGFGKKPDFETGRTLDLDKTYKTIIRPSVEAAGLKCIRADEIIQSGMLEVPLYEQLLNADMVVADLSTSNRDAYYQLGVRHALRPYTTIIICEDSVKWFPFDISRNLVHPYHHMETGVDFEEVLRFREVLSNAISQILASQPTPLDSPVYQFLPQLTPPTLAEHTSPTAEAMKPADVREDEDSSAVRLPLPSLEPSPQSKALAEFVERAEEMAEHTVAESWDSGIKNLFTVVLKFLNSEQGGGPTANTPDMIHRLVQAACKVGGSDRFETLKLARRIFDFLLPLRSTDPATLQLLGDVELAIFEERKEVNRLKSARQAYERLYTIKCDIHSGATLAYLVTLHAEYKRDFVEKLNDIVYTSLLRRKVVEAGYEKLTRIDERFNTETRLMKQQGISCIPAKIEAEQEELEVWGALAEAYYGLGDLDNYRMALDTASERQGGEGVIKAVSSRIERLAPLMERR
jgi:hypothetical protein